MINRLKVNGFKNLNDFEIHFGPFNCIAGLNAAGKSNLFDALRFLHLLAKHPIMEAVAKLRGPENTLTSPEGLFSRHERTTADILSIEADLFLERNVTDDFGEIAEAAISSVKYSVSFKKSTKGNLQLFQEELRPIPLGKAKKQVGYNSSKEFRNSLFSGRRSVPFISTDQDARVHIHQEKHGGRKLSAPKSSRTVVMGSASADFATILAVNREFQRWKFLNLEPSAMRAPSSFRDEMHITDTGGNLPNAIHRVKAQYQDGVLEATLANRLKGLVDDVKDIRLRTDDVREIRVLEACGMDGQYHPAQALSDGTLRFIVLLALELDQENNGLLCLEEPENGIHPSKIPTIVDVLSDLSVDPFLAVGPENPARQVLFNTHSPKVVSCLKPDQFILMEERSVFDQGDRRHLAHWYALPGTWREKIADRHHKLNRGKLADYFEQKINEQSQGVFEFYREGLTL